MCKHQYCLACETSAHPNYDCPFTTYQKNARLVISKYNFSIPICQRKKVLRMRSRFETLKKMPEIRSILREFRITQVYYKEDPDSLMDILDQIDKLDDRGFFLKVPGIVVNIGPNQYAYDHNQQQQQFLEYDNVENEDLRQISQQFESDINTKQSRQSQTSNLTSGKTQGYKKVPSIEDALSNRSIEILDQLKSNPSMKSDEVTDNKTIFQYNNDQISQNLIAKPEPILEEQSPTRQKKLAMENILVQQSQSTRTLALLEEQRLTNLSNKSHKNSQTSSKNAIQGKPDRQEGIRKSLIQSITSKRSQNQKVRTINEEIQHSLQEIQSEKKLKEIIGKTRQSILLMHGIEKKQSNSSITSNQQLQTAAITGCQPKVSYIQQPPG